MSTIIYQLFLYLVEAFILLYYMGHIAEARNSTLCRIATIFASYTVACAVSLAENVWINMLLFFLANTLCIYLLTTIKLYSALFHAAVLCVLMILSEIIVIVLNTQIFAHFIDNRSYSSPDVILLAFSSKLIYLFMVRTALLIMRGHREQPYVVPSLSALLLNLIPLFSIFILLTFCTLLETESISGAPRQLVFTSMVLITLINLLIVWLYDQVQRKNAAYTAMQLQLQQEHDMSEYYKMLIYQDEEQKILIHDIKKHLNSIAMLNHGDDRSAIDEYIQHILKNHLPESVRVSDNDLLNSILSHYIRLCKKKNISLHIDVRSGLLTGLDHEDMTALIANLLDNAVEAAEAVPDGSIDLNIHRPENSASTMIALINSCQSDPFDPDSGKLRSHKQNPMRHGYGLRSIERTVKRYDGTMTMYYKDDEKEFHTIILINDLH